MKLIILVSGNGTNLQYLIDKAKHLNYEIIGVISNKKEAYGLIRAKNNYIPNIYIPYIRKELSRNEYDEKLSNYILNNFEFDLIILDGWMLIFSDIFLCR